MKTKIYKLLTLGGRSRAFMLVSAPILLGVVILTTTKLVLAVNPPLPPPPPEVGPSGIRFIFNGIGPVINVDGVTQEGFDDAISADDVWYRWHPEDHEEDRPANIGPSIITLQE